jgi:hypothetical protein
MGHTARAHSRRRLGRVVASRGRYGACQSHRDRDALPAAHTRAAPRAPPLAPAGEGGRVARAAQRVLVPQRLQCAAGSTHMCRTAHVCPPPVPAGEGGCVARAAHHVLVPQRSRRTACGTHQCRLGRRSRRAGGTERARPTAIAKHRRRHTRGPHGARPPPVPAGEGGGWSHCAGGTACASPTALATHCRRHTHGQHCTHHQPAPAGEGSRVAREAQHVLVPPPLAAHTWAGARLHGTLTRWE